MDLYIQIAKELCDKLKENNIKYFIDFGTLLGAYRENNLLNNDIDFDILYVDDEENKNFLFSFIFSDIIKKYNLNILSTNWGINYNLSFEKNKFRFEFYPIEIKEKRYWPKNLKGYQMPLFFIDELETIKIKNIDFPCPRHLNQYLIHRYGFDYKIPKSKTDDNKLWSDCINNIVPIKDKYVALTSGVFDLTHYGHFKLFERIKNSFDKLIVGVHTDEDTVSFKRKPIYDLTTRCYMVSSCKFVDDIDVGSDLVVKKDTLIRLNADYVVAGRDSNSHISNFYKIENEKLHLINRTENISTSKLLNSLNF